MFCHHNKMYYLCNVFRGSASMTNKRIAVRDCSRVVRCEKLCKYTAFLFNFQNSNNKLIKIKGNGKGEEEENRYQDGA